MIFRDGWYYLLVTHGSCCAGANSTYNIRMGRARKVTGPFRRQHGHRHAAGRRQAVSRIERPLHRPGTFRSARSRRRRAEVLAATTRRTSIAAASACSTSARCSGATAGRWPATTSRRAPTRSNPREPARRSRLAVQGVPVGGARGRGGRGGRPGWRTGGAERGRRRTRRRRGGDPIPAQDAAQVSAQLAGRPDRRAHVAVHGCRRSRSGPITPVANAGGYPGSPYFKITDRRNRSRARGHGATRELVALPAFTGGPEQLWRIDQLTDGTYRVMPKARTELEGAAGALGRRQQHADAGAVQSRQRSAALAVQDAMTADRTAKSMSSIRRTLCRALIAAPDQCAVRWPLRRRSARRRAGAAARRPAPSLVRPRRRRRRQTPTASCSAG